MKLASIEMCGFRGFRDLVRIEFGLGFTVVSGRNGVGKSTICDAIEFALTGSIEKYGVTKADGESLSDYLWWRGDGGPDSCYVIACFVDHDGEQVSVTRTREQGANMSAEEIEDVLCAGSKPEEPISQLCKTSIIRDEWIASLSLDLGETDRFKLVSAAIGPSEGAERLKKAKEVVARTKDAYARAEGEYEAARARLAEGLSLLSEASDAVSRVGDVDASRTTVLSAIEQDPRELSVAIERGQAVLTSRKTKLLGLSDAVRAGKEVANLREVFNSRAEVGRRDDAKRSLESAVYDKSHAEELVAAAQLRLEAAEHSHKTAAALGSLIESGQQLGLLDGHCPLCAAPRTISEYETGIEHAANQVRELALEIDVARRILRSHQESLSVETSKLSDAEAIWTEIELEEKRIVAAETAHIELFDRFGMDYKFAKDPDSLEVELRDERDRLIELEGALLTLRASETVSRVASLEVRAKELRGEADSAAEKASRAKGALIAAREIEATVKRVSGEIIDERLAQISPLLKEFYQRLRPHADWRSIDYSIRGDVRRFLTLKVGDGLNPQFLFSSGQRRAAGLAFLLSVHLARAWSRWDSLILDDPVQHIDDFRALHLAEVLAALRMGGRQVICAVEDPALADMLCRRLISSHDQPGRRYDLELGSAGVPVVSNTAEVLPMLAGVLRGTEVAKAAS